MEAASPALFPCCQLPWRCVRPAARLLVASGLAIAALGSVLAITWLAKAQAAGSFQQPWAPEASGPSFLLLLATSTLAAPPALWLLSKASTPFLLGTALLAVGNWASQVSYLLAVMPMVGNPLALPNSFIRSVHALTATLLFAVPVLAATLVLWRLCVTMRRGVLKAAWLQLLAVPPLAALAAALYLTGSDKTVFFKGLVVVMVAMALAELLLITRGFMQASRAAGAALRLTAPGEEEKAGRRASRQLRMEAASFALGLFFVLLHFLCVLELRGFIGVLKVEDLSFTALHRFASFGDVLCKASLALALSGAFGGKEAMEEAKEASPQWIFGEAA